MPKRTSKKGNNRDINMVATRVVGEATKENVSTTIEQEIQVEEKNPNAVALGRLGGKKGGVARAKKLSPERRKEIAKKAAQTRWLSI